MGVVWRGWDTELRRAVAVKIVPMSTADDVDRFQIEARALAALSHPNVVRLFDAEIRVGSAMLVMELLEGKSLEQRVRSGRMTAIEVMRILRGILDGLQHAHDRAVLHRDVKPSNVFLCQDARPVIIDFGLARFARRACAVTTGGRIIGTPRYLPPEAWSGAPIGISADLFAAGLVGLEALTGSHPALGRQRNTTIQECALCVSSGEYYGRVQSLLEGRTSLERVLLRALTPDPRERYASAREMRDALVSPAWRAGRSTDVALDSGDRLARELAGETERPQHTPGRVSSPVRGSTGAGTWIWRVVAVLASALAITSPWFQSVLR
jgi:serine/threonine-protein kinase